MKTEGSLAQLFQEFKWPCLCGITNGIMVRNLYNSQLSLHFHDTEFITAQTALQDSDGAAS